MDGDCAAQQCFVGDASDPLILVHAREAHIAINTSSEDAGATYYMGEGHAFSAGMVVEQDGECACKARLRVFHLVSKRQ